MQTSQCLFFGLAITLRNFPCSSYYVRSVDSSPAQFYVPEVMDSLLHDMEAVGAIVRKTAPGLPIWLGETSSASGGGVAGISDRYLGGFL